MQSIVLITEGRLTTIAVHSFIVSLLKIDINCNKEKIFCNFLFYHHTQIKRIRRNKILLLIGRMIKQ